MSLRIMVESSGGRCAGIDLGAILNSGSPWKGWRNRWPARGPNFDRPLSFLCARPGLDVVQAAVCGWGRHRLELGIDLALRSQELADLRLREFWTLPEIELIEGVADLGQFGHELGLGRLHDWSSEGGGPRRTSGQC